MAKYRVRILLVIAAVLLLGVIAYSYAYQGRQPLVRKKVSVIVYGDNVQRWENFQQGINQAALDLNAEVTFLTTMTDDIGVGEQRSLVYREERNKAEGLIVAAVNSKEMTEPIEEVNKQIPVVMAETAIDETKESIKYVSADNLAMGEELAKIIVAEQGRTTPIYLVDVNGQRNSIQARKEGLIKVLEASGYKVVRWQPEDSSAILPFVEEQQKLSAPGIIVALDELTLEAIVDGTPKLQEEFSLYGIGSTAKIVYYLDQGAIKGIVFQDEYNMGYTSMVRLFEKISNDKGIPAVSGEIEVHSANKDNVHLPEEERLLYPIIQ